MITGEPKSKIERVWDAFWSGGISNPLERNRGLRIDFVLGSPSLTQRVIHAFIDREERAGQGASDHAPVLVDLGPAAG